MTSARIAVEVQSRVWFDDIETARSIGQAVEKLLGSTPGAVRLEGPGYKRLPLHPVVWDRSRVVRNHQTVDGETRTIINEIEKLAKTANLPEDALSIPSDEFWADFREKCLNPELVDGRRVCAVDYVLLSEKVSARLNLDAAETADTLKTVLGNIAAAAAIREFSTATAVKKVRN